MSIQSPVAHAFRLWMLLLAGLSLSGLIARAGDAAPAPASSEVLDTFVEKIQEQMRKHFPNIEFDVQVDEEPLSDTGLDANADPAAAGATHRATIRFHASVNIYLRLDPVKGEALASLPGGQTPPVPVGSALSASPLPDMPLGKTVLEELPSYEAVDGVRGKLLSVGSDTLNNVMQVWAEHFAKLYPDTRMEHRGTGSRTAPKPLREGTAQLAPMSIPMTEEQLALFEMRLGYRPTRVTVGLDCVAVYVHAKNPIKGLALAQLDAIFGRDMHAGQEAILSWGQIRGMPIHWLSQPVRLYGRNSNSGTHRFFRKHVLLNGEFRGDIVELPSSASVVNAIAENKAAIGYSGIGFQLDGVRTVPLAAAAGQAYVDPTFDNARNGSYPLGRALYIYLRKPPNTPVPVLEREFLRFALSRQGQELLAGQGFGAVPEESAAAMRALLE